MQTHHARGYSLPFHGSSWKSRRFMAVKLFQTVQFGRSRTTLLHTDELLRQVANSLAKVGIEVPFARRRALERARKPVGGLLWSKARQGSTRSGIGSLKKLRSIFCRRVTGPLTASTPSPALRTDECGESFRKH